MPKNQSPHANKIGLKSDAQNERVKLATEFSGAEIVTEFLASLQTQTASTRDVYGRTLYQMTGWIAQRPGSNGGFSAETLTRSALIGYLGYLEQEGLSLNSRLRVKVVAGRFARWLTEEKGLLTKNPVRDVLLPPQQVLAPRELTSDQRYVLHNLVEREASLRSAALFALGYWAGCRVSDVAHLQNKNAHIGPKVGWLHIGYKGGKMRDIDLINEARRALQDYLESDERRESDFVFVSQRADHLTENGIHRWFATLKKQARKEEWELVQDITFHDLRHDFAHRARASGWSLEEIAYYLGHVTARGLPAIQTTVRYTQVSREQVKNKLRLLRG
jgi:site-specific recombinase XerD